MVVSLSEECWSYTNFWTFFGWWWLRCIVRFTSRRANLKLEVKFWREKKVHYLHLDHDIFLQSEWKCFSICSQDKSNSIVIEKKLRSFFMKPLGPRLSGTVSRIWRKRLPLWCLWQCCSRPLPEGRSVKVSVFRSHDNTITYQLTRLLGVLKCRSGLEIWPIAIAPEAFCTSCSWKGCWWTLRQFTWPSAEKLKLHERSWMLSYISCLDVGLVGFVSQRIVKMHFEVQRN